MRTAKFVVPIVPGVFSNPTLTVDSQGLVAATPGGTLAQCIATKNFSVVAVGPNTNLPFTTPLVDPLGMFNGTETITIPTAGRYLVSYNINMQGITPTSVALFNAGSYIGAETFGTPFQNTSQGFRTASLFNFGGGETLTLRNMLNNQSYTGTRFVVIQLS